MRSLNTKIISGTMVSLRTKLLIPTLLTALLAVAAVICISILQYKSFQYQTDKEIIHLKQDLHHLIEDMQNESRNLVKLLSNKWVFLDNVISNNIDGLLDELTSFHKSSLHDFIAVYDMEGIIIARGDSPDHFGMSDDLHQYIMKVKAEKESMSLVTLYDNKLLIFELKCLDAGYGPIGFLAAGQYLDKKNVNTFSQLGQLYLEFQYKGVAVVSSKNFELPENIDKNKFQIDFDDQFTQKPSLSAILWKDTAEITSRFWKNLSLVVTALGLISCLVIFFSRRIIVKTVTALDEARISAQQEIFERKQAQEKLKRLNEDLESRVQNRTQNLKAEIVVRKKTEKALIASEKKYRSMMEAMEDPVSICSSDYRIEYMNPAMIKRVGRDATGETCFKAIHGLKEKCPWCIADKTQQGISFKTDIVSPLDNRSYHISHSPVIYKDDTISKMTVFSDTTNLKKIEAQLQQSQKMESIGTLAGGIAHDFNNILFPIMGRTEMLLQDIPEDSPFHASLNEIFTSALRASDLVKQILTFSRQDTNELSLMKIQPVIKEALKLIRSTIPTTIEIKQYIRNDCGAIKADPTQIHQVVMNLTTNAYHAMEKAGGELKVTLKEIQLGDDDVITPDIMPGVYACLTIADTGTGMDKDIFEKIFDPFFTTKKQGKGTGMGLSVVHGIVNSMGGAIQAYSEPGKGTEFKVYFPVEKSSFEKHSTQTKEPVRGGTERILLVDDEEAIIAMEKQILEHLGYQVTSHNNSIEALEAFGADPDKFDLVITDMAMPNMSGDKLAAGLIEIRSDIPILLCTGFSGTISEEKAASLGMKGFILKPIVMKDLANKIREVLGEN